MPSIHSSVMTSRAQRSQSTFGTRKSSSPWVFSANSDAAGSLQAEIHLDLDRARQSIDHADRIEPLRLVREPLRLPRGEKHVAEIAPEPALDAGTQAP